MLVHRRVRSSSRRRSSRPNSLLANLTAQSVVTDIRADGKRTSADQQWTVLDSATQLLRTARHLYNVYERATALELRRIQRTTNESLVELLRDACDRPGKRGDQPLEADSDGAELYRRSKQRPAAQRQHRAVHALEVHEPLTSFLDRAMVRQHAAGTRRRAEQRQIAHPLDVQTPLTNITSTRSCDYHYGNSGVTSNSTLHTTACWAAPPPPPLSRS